MNVDQIENALLSTGKIAGSALASFGLVTAQQAAQLQASLPAGNTSGTSQAVSFFLAFVGVIIAGASFVVSHFSNATPATPTAPATAPASPPASTTPAA